VASFIDAGLSNIAAIPRRTSAGRAASPRRETRARTRSRDARQTIQPNVNKAVFYLSASAIHLLEKPGDVRGISPDTKDVISVFFSEECGSRRVSTSRRFFRNRSIAFSTIEISLSLYLFLLILFSVRMHAESDESARKSETANARPNASELSNQR